MNAKQGDDYSGYNEERMNAERVRESAGLVQLLGGGRGGRRFADDRPLFCVYERGREGRGGLVAVLFYPSAPSSFRSVLFRYVSIRFGPFRSVSFLYVTFYLRVVPITFRYVRFRSGSIGSVSFRSCLFCLPLSPC